MGDLYGTHLRSDTSADCMSALNVLKGRLVSAQVLVQIRNLNISASHRTLEINNTKFKKIALNVI